MANEETIGAQLKKLRLDKGISLDDAHKHTKIHPDVLKAIEEDNYININPVYLKGFLKIYCQYLGVELPENFADKKHTRVQSNLGRAQKKDEAVRVSLQPQNPKEGLGRVSAQKACERKPSLPVEELVRKFLPALIIAVAALCAVALLFAAGKFVISGLSSSRNVKHAQIVRLKKEKIARATKSRAAVPVKPAVSGVKEEQIPAEDSLRLGVRALEDCWLQLKVDNKVVFQNILQRGRFESWEANDRLDIALGSAGGVQIEINGKLIPPLGKRGQVLKDIVITRKEGLKVGK
jgi:cytoskeleton protein RodZ